MSTDIAKMDIKAEVIEKVVIAGDLRRLSDSMRVDYYMKVCETLGVNPFTKPFEYIDLNGKLTLYATRACTEQLRRIYGISIEITSREKVGDVYIVTAKATDSNGRFDESVGAVNLGNLKGDAMSNAIMKAETKAKRRVTLSIAGLGWIDETEVETIPNAKKTVVDENGVIVEVITQEQRKELFEVARNNNELVMHIIKKYGYLRTDEITKHDYNDICSEISNHILEAELDCEVDNE